ncbi:lytic transglycosylase domain-containing protein [Aestuariibius insulae]|uniref:lytic transglycosylase domain-containing protein n=1 Tax=Aestuariibius insulae TaxID=2058287 RepID=UPI00345EE855
MLVLSFLAVVPANNDGALAQQSARTAAASPYARFVAEATQRFGIPEAWIWAVMAHESGGDPRAVSLKGAQGLMQIMPTTWAELTARYRLGSDPFDPRANVLGGTAYLREMYDRYGEVAPMLAAYNAGPARVDEWLATGRALPRETRAYVAAILPRIGGGPAPATRAVDPHASPIFVPLSGIATPIDEPSDNRRAASGLSESAPSAGPPTDGRSAD